MTLRVTAVTDLFAIKSTLCFSASQWPRNDRFLACKKQRIKNLSDTNKIHKSLSVKKLCLLLPVATAALFSSLFQKSLEDHTAASCLLFVSQMRTNNPLCSTEFLSWYPSPCHKWPALQLPVSSLAVHWHQWPYSRYKRNHGDREWLTAVFWELYRRAKCSSSGQYTRAAWKELCTCRNRQYFTLQGQQLYVTIRRLTFLTVTEQATYRHRGKEGMGALKRLIYFICVV